MPGMRAAACLTAVSLAVGLRAAAGPVPSRDRSAAPGTASAAPAWLTRLPEDPDTWRGLGHADKRAHPYDYADRARTAALAQIARAISITINSESRSARADGAAGYRESWAESTSASAAAELSGYRLEGSYETEVGYWALYALDEEMYARGLERSLAGPISGLESRSGAIETDLRARRLQAACDRDSTGPAGMAGMAGTPAGDAALERYWRASERLRAAAADAELAIVPAHWTFPTATGAEDSAPRAVLRDRDGCVWKGLLRLRIRRAAGPDSVSCPVRTDGQGRIDPAAPFLACGLAPGGWRVEWIGPGGSIASASVTAAWRPRPVRIEVRDEVPLGAWASGRAWSERSKAELERDLGPRFTSARAGERNAGSLELILTGATLDSLAGMRFAGLRAKLRLPDGSAPVRLSGKGGHADAKRACESALEDLLSEARRALSGLQPAAGR